MAECIPSTILIWRGRKRAVPSTALRMFYATNVCPIPEGYHIRHLCGNPSCIEPTHLAALPPFTKLGAAPNP